MALIQTKMLNARPAKQMTIPGKTARNWKRNVKKILRKVKSPNARLIQNPQLVEKLTTSQRNVVRVLRAHLRPKRMRSDNKNIDTSAGEGKCKKTNDESVHIGSTNVQEA